MSVMFRSTASAAVLLAAVLLAAPAAAQSGAARRGGTTSPPLPSAAVPAEANPGQGDTRLVLAGDENARETRDRLQRLFEQYPPTLRGVLQRDPSLLHNDAYLAPYPALSAFLGQHPEVAHNPSFFLGTINQDFSSRDPSSDRIRAVGVVFSELFVLTGFMSFFTLLGFVTKTLVEHRRFTRVSKVQNEAHAKLMDRLTSNDDLLAYVQSPAGQRYFEAAPLRIETAGALASAPYSRILWSVQAGMVAVCVGLGLLFVSGRWAVDADWSGDVSRMLLLLGVVSLAAGIGFVLSGIASYVLSRRLGLIQAPASSHA